MRKRRKKKRGQRRQIRSRTEKAGTSTTTVEGVATRKNDGGKEAEAERW